MASPGVMWNETTNLRRITAKSIGAPQASVNQRLSPFHIDFVHVHIQVANFWNQISWLVWKSHKSLVLITGSVVLFLTVETKSKVADNTLK